MSTLLVSLPPELWFSHIFEYLLGPISNYLKDMHDDDYRISMIKLKEIKANKFRFDLDNLRGLNSLSCACTELRKLFIADFHDEYLSECGQFWINISNLVELTNYFNRFEGFSSMTLTRGDLDEVEALDMARIQVTLENIEMGMQSSAQSISDSCDRHYIYNDVKNWEDSTNMSNIENDFEERMSRMITSKSKYYRLRSKTGISAYELFIYKAHVMCLGMVPNFDSEKKIETSSGYWSSNKVHTLLSLHLNSNNLGEGQYGLLLDEFEPKDLNIYNQYLSINLAICWTRITSITFSNNLQYLSISINLEYGNHEQEDFTNMFQDCHFPNLKLLSLFIDDKDRVVYDVEKYKFIEKSLLQNITKAIFPKIIHLSLTRFFDCEPISKIEVLDQLVCLELNSGFFGYEDVQTFIWKDGGVMNMLNDTYFKEGNDHCMQLLIIYNAIDIRWMDADLDTMEEFYNKCKESFIAGSFSHSSILEYYQSCNE